MPQGRYMKVGSEIGWLGFPAIAAKDLCFFSGQVSATQADRNRYLVDGVVIHGVSGGPAFSVYGIDEPSAGPTVIGLATAYMPNRTLRDPLPGLSVIDDVQDLSRMVSSFQSFDEAQEEAASHPDPPPPPEPPSASG